MWKTCVELVIDIQNGLLEAGFNEEEVAKVLNDMVKNADFAGIGKSMMAVLDGHARLKVCTWYLIKCVLKNLVNWYGENFKILVYQKKLSDPALFIGTTEYMYNYIVNAWESGSVVFKDTKI